MGLHSKIKFVMYLLLCVLTGLLNAQKITVVMESYPPNSYYNDAPSKIAQDVFKNELINKVNDPDNLRVIKDCYRFDEKSQSYFLKDELRSESLSAKLEDLKKTLILADFLQPAGLEVEITREVFLQMGMKPEYKIFPWNRCLEMMKAGDADAIITVFRTREREQFLYYASTCNVMEENALFRLNESKIDYDGNLEKLKKHWIAVKSSTSYGRKFDESKFLLRREVSYNQDIIRLVENKRVDLGIGPVRSITYFAKKMNNFNKITFLKPLICNDPLYTAFSKKKHNKNLAEEFSKHLQVFKKTSKYREILSRYGV